MGGYTSVQTKYIAFGERIEAIFVPTKGPPWQSRLPQPLPQDRMKEDHSKNLCAEDSDLRMAGWASLG